MNLYIISQNKEITITKIYSPLVHVGDGGAEGAPHAYSRLDSYSIFVPTVWALIQGGHLFDVRRLIE